MVIILLLIADITFFGNSSKVSRSIFSLNFTSSGDIYKDIGNNVRCLFILFMYHRDH